MSYFEKNMLFKQLSTLLLFAICVLSQYSTSTPLRKTYNIKSYPDNIFNEIKAVNDIIQDKEGFIWFAASSGLYRFDGYDIKEYSRESHNKQSLPHFHINQLLLDNKHNLWIGTAAGLAIYDKTTDSFNHVNISNTDIKPVIISLFQDSRDNLWIGTRRQGVFKYSQKESQWKNYRSDNNSALTISSNFVKHISEDSTGNIWISTIKGLNQLSHADNSISIFEVGSSHKNTIYSSLSLQDDEFLVGSKEGVFLFDKEERKFKTYNPAGFALSDNHVRSLSKGNNNELFIGTNNGGLNIYDRKNHTTQLFEKSNLKKYSIKSNTVRKSYMDKNEDLWVGTNSGFYKILYKKKLIELYRSDNNLKECLSEDESYAILASTNQLEGILWIAVEGKGLHKIDLKKSICHFYNKDNINLEGVNLDFILDIKQDSSGNLWLANYQEGLIKLNTKTNIFSRVKTENQELSDILNSGFIYKLLIDQEGRIWAGLSNEGLLMIDSKTEAITSYEKTIKTQLGAERITIKNLTLQNNQLWLGTSYQGLVSFDLNTEKTTQYVRKGKDAEGLPENITASKISDDGILWLGSRGYGLYKFNTANGKYHHYNKQDGLTNNTIWNIESDSYKNIWISTDNGLSVLSSKSGTFINYFDNDGLQSNEATTSGSYDSVNQVIWTGGMTGINKINTKHFNQLNSDEVPTITDFKLNYQSVPVSNSNEKGLLKKNIHLINQLNLSYDKNNFSFSFAVLNHNNPTRLKYQYKLENYDDWNNIDKDSRHANYTNIDPGSYIFKVRAATNGSWGNQFNEIKITISPPWWKTDIAYISYIIFAITSLFLIINFRTRSLTRRANKLEESVARRTTQLADEKSKVEQLLSRKNEELANISHEFRTPLTLILGPLAEVIKNNINKPDHTRLNIIQRNGYRLLRMVDQLLNLETFRIKSITQKSAQPISQITQLLSDAFSDLAREKQLNLSIKESIDISFEFTPDAYEKIFLNLLSNAIKYSKPGDQILVSTRRNQHNQFELTVTDTGIGMPEEKLEMIFERYNRILDDNSEQVTGAGIGLSIVKELIEAHDGSISIESQLGRGSKITVLLPINREVDPRELEAHSNDEIVAMEMMSLAPQNTVQKTTQAEQRQSLSNNPLLLIIEDNPDMRQYIKTSIEQDYKVITAANGVEGVKLAKQEVPDLIISDIMMPQMDGYQTANAIRNSEITSHIPIILLTARGDRESRLKGWYERADEYLTKPFDVEELKIRLNNLLEIRNILKKRFGELAFDSKLQVDSNESDDVLIRKSERQIGFIQKLNETLEEIYTSAGITIPEIAEQLEMSERQFFRKVKAVLNMTPLEYLRRFRLEKAKPLLEAGKTASFATYEVGFSTQSHFTSCFKAQFGISPGEYKSSFQRKF